MFCFVEAPAKPSYYYEHLVTVQLAWNVITAVAVRETGVGRNKRMSNCCGRAHRASLATRLQSAPRVACWYVYVSVTPKISEKTALVTEASTRDALSRVGLGSCSAQLLVGSYPGHKTRCLRGKPPLVQLPKRDHTEWDGRERNQFLEGEVPTLMVET